MSTPRGISEPLCPVHECSDAFEWAERCRNLAQKWLKEVACIPRSGGESGKDDPFLANRLQQTSITPRAALGNRGFPPESVALQISRVGRRIASNTPNLRASCVLPQFVGRILFGIPDRLTDFV